MSAFATVNSGAGLTTVVTHAKNHLPLHVHLPEAMCVDWQEKEKLCASMETADVLLIGPGLGTSSKSLELLSLNLDNQKSNQWLVIDGSALTLLAKKQWSLPFPKQTILTPHQMEWQRVSSLPILKNRLRKTIENNNKKSVQQSF